MARDDAPLEAPSSPGTEDPVARAPVRGQNAIASLVPFGLGKDKPHHYREMLEVLRENRDSLPYAWRILSQGVCDGCSLGPRGLHDDVIDGVHLCLTRLRLLRLNTMPALAPADLLDIERLRQLDNRALQALGRLSYPYVYRKGDRGFSRVSWDEALSLVGEAAREVPPERMGFFATSRGITNEAYYTFSKAARLLGTNNVDLCARLCHAATVVGLKRTLGLGAPTCSLADLIGTDLLLLLGTNLANNQPVTMKYLLEARRRGTRVVVVNPVLEKGLEAYWVPSDAMSAVFGTRLTDDFIQIKAGGDIAFLNGVLKALDELGAVDRAFVERATAGWPELAAHLRGLRWEDLEESAGVSRREMAWVAELYGRANTAVTVYSMGLTQHRFGVENVEAVVNLHLARGMIGRPKTGIMPIRGHSGVQGGGECGVAPDTYPGPRPVNEETAAELSALWNGHPVPTWKGLTTGPMMEAAERGEIDFFYSVGGNLLLTMPDPERVAGALRKVRVRVHQDIVVNTSALLEPGELVVLLPAQTRYEQRGGGTSTSTERRIRFSPEIPGHPQVGECRPEWEIPCLVALALRPDLADSLTYQDSAGIRREIAAVMPLYAGIERLQQAGDWVQWGGPQLYADGTFPKMPEGRARFTVLDLPDLGSPKGSFYLTTRRGKQFNSIVIDDQDKLQGGRGRNDLFLSEADAAMLGVSEGDALRLKSASGEWVGYARPISMARGVVQAYWPECNPLIGMRLDPRSEEPDYNTPVEIQRA